jgi:superfamily II RNA helicase
VKCIIFDEIHCIGQADDGLVWEQLLLLAPCQIIALSATVGNPEEFNNWLMSTQESLHIPLTMVRHKHRYSDLRKYIFIPPENFTFEGLCSASLVPDAFGLDHVPELRYLHPVASLVNKNRGIPDDLALEPRDCFLLWRCMDKHQTPAFPVPQELHPSRALPSFIQKAHVFEWEEHLKALLLEWMNRQDSPFDNVRTELEGDLRNEESTLIDSEEDLDHQHNYFNTVLPLLVRLHENNSLPAILFNYDRSACEMIAQLVLAQLELAETEFKATDTMWMKTMEDYEQWEIDSKARSSQNVEHAKKKKSKGMEDSDERHSSKSDAARDAANCDRHKFEFFNPDRPLDQFSFADVKKLELAELEEAIEELKDIIAPWQIDALERGIGVHHAGMNRKYRQM